MALDALKKFFKYKACGDRLYYRNRLVIPNHNKLKLKLFKYIYNLLVAG